MDALSKSLVVKRSSERKGPRDQCNATQGIYTEKDSLSLYILTCSCSPMPLQEPKVGLQFIQCSGSGRPLAPKVQGSPGEGSFLPEVPVPFPKIKTDRRRKGPVLDVYVFPEPVRSDEEQTVWAVAVRPETFLRRGQNIALKTSRQTSGIGRLSSLKEMFRHWVSFGITGSGGKCCLHVPIPWVSLSDIECLVHTRHYSTLPALPPPHPDFDNPLITGSDESPYEFGKDGDTGDRSIDS